MSKITCIVIEDEPLAARILVDYISQVPFLELTKTFKDAILATEYLRIHHPDLIFLDIHLPKLKGIAFLKTLAAPPAIIITTAYHQYAVEGFTLNVTDYLLKPIAFERFLVAVNKVRTVQKETVRMNGNAEPKDCIFLNVMKKKVRVLFSEIVYIESQREYVKIVTTKNAWVSKMSTREIEELLPVAQFCRVHRSFIIAVTKVESYTAESVEVSGVSIPVGRAYRNVLDKW